MLAGGNGMPPMAQILSAALADENDRTQWSLVCNARAELDVLYRDLVDDLAAKHPNRLKICYTLDEPPEGWSHARGAVTDEMISMNLPAAAKGTLILLCGPGKALTDAWQQQLSAAGHKEGVQLLF